MRISQRDDDNGAFNHKEITKRNKDVLAQPRDGEPLDRKSRRGRLHEIIYHPNDSIKEK